jgi:hypothetical protein
MLDENPLLMIPSEFEFDRDEEIPVEIKPYL